MNTNLQLKKIAQTMRYLSEGKGDFAFAYKRGVSQLLHALFALMDDDNREVINDIILYYIDIEERFYND